MANKKVVGINLGLILAVAGCIFGLCALIGLALTGFTGSTSIFGTTTTAESETLGVLTFGKTGTKEYANLDAINSNAGLIVAFVLAILGALVSLTRIKFKFIPLAGAVLMVTAGILYFCALPLLGASSTEGITYALGAGPILSGIFCLVGACCTGVSCFLG